MNHLVESQKKFLTESIQSAFSNEEQLFQIIDLFPIPIEIFAPDGTAVFANRAVLEMWNISDSSQIVGKYNLKQDPVVNERLGLSEYVHRTFKGEVVLVPDVKVPLEDFSSWYTERNPDYNVESMYTDILNFPIYNDDMEITHIVSLFITTRIYEGKSDIARAKEYMENNWLEDFDIDKIAQAVHLSRYHFARLFKKHTTMTPYAYYQAIKIRRLKEALCDTNLSIAEAFAACGEVYKGNYLKIFKEKTGMTPSQYRKAALHNK